MGFSAAIDDEDDDQDVTAADARPVSSLAGPQTTRDQVMQRIADVRNPTGSTATSSAGVPDDGRDAAALQFARNNATTAGVGRALNALAAGTGFHPDNGGNEAIEKQSDLAMKELDRSAAVRKAVENRKAMEARENAALQARKDNQDRLQKNTDRAFNQHQQEVDLKRNELADARGDKMAAAMKADLDPNGGRAGNMGKNQARVDTADRLLQLAEQAKTQPGGLDSRQMEEYAIGIQNLLSGSSSGAVAQVQALVPHTFWGKAQNLVEWLTNNPTGTDQQNFVKRMTDTVQRERGVSADQVKNAQVQRLSAHGALQSKDPDTYNSILGAYGIDPSTIKDGRYMAPPKGKSPDGPAPEDGGLIPSVQAGSGSGFNASDLQALQWAHSNPGDPRAQKIMQQLKGKGL